MAGRAYEHEDVGVFGFALLELVEEGTRVGDAGAAATALRRLEERTVAAGTECALGVLARSRALLLASGAAASPSTSPETHRRTLRRARARRRGR